MSKIKTVNFNEYDKKTTRKVTKKAEIIKFPRIKKFKSGVGARILKGEKNLTIKEVNDFLRGA